jgi:hypothetical protein
MKTLILHTENESQTNSVVKLAHSLHIKVEIVDDKDSERQVLLKLAESSFAKEWNSDEDAHWNDFLKKAKDVSKR